eukprot:gene1971-2151_t
MLAVVPLSLLFVFSNNLHSSDAQTFSYSSSEGIVRGQSRGWELARQKRTAAVRELAKTGVLRIDTDDRGNQFLSLPWLPDRRLPYKSLSVQQRLLNEVFAGAMGEIAKDALLHWVDTLKTRRQASVEPLFNTTVSVLRGMRDLYAGFPAVATASLAQGGVFFLVKQGWLEAVGDSPLETVIAISLGVSAYWIFRTPAEVVKTQVQTGQAETVRLAWRDHGRDLGGLFMAYPVVLWLDIPFQLINFLLYGTMSQALANAGVPVSVWSRLLTGVGCGMTAAALTCPLDVCKTRILARNRARKQVSSPLKQEQEEIEERSKPHIPEASSNVPAELVRLVQEEGPGALLLGLRQRLLYTGLANGIRLAAYGTSRMDLMMRSLDDL